MLGADPFSATLPPENSLATSFAVLECFFARAQAWIREVHVQIAFAGYSARALIAFFQTLRTGPLPAPRAFAALFQIIPDTLRGVTRDTLRGVWILADRATVGKVLLLLPRRPVLKKAKMVV